MERLKVTFLLPFCWVSFPFVYFLSVCALDTVKVFPEIPTIHMGSYFLITNFLAFQTHKPCKTPVDDFRFRCFHSPEQAVSPLALAFIFAILNSLTWVVFILHSMLTFFFLRSLMLRRSE